MVQDIVGSRMAPDTKYGQNGDATPSSIHKGDVIKRGTVAAEIAPKQTAVPGLDDQDQLSRRVKMGDDGKAAEIAPAHGMRHRGIGDGSPGTVMDATRGNIHAPKR